MPWMGNMTTQQCMLLVITGFTMGGVTALYDEIKARIGGRKSNGSSDNHES